MRKLDEQFLRKMIRQEIREDKSRQSRRSLYSMLFEEDAASTDASKEKPEAASSDKKVDTSKLPMKLSQVDAEFAKKLCKSGDKELDKITVTKGEVGKCSKLMPSQTTMNVDKATQFALGMINGTMFGSGGPGGDLNCFVSSDNYIMDGHHRWIATGMVKPDASLSGYKANLPAKELLSVLNTVTKGMFGRDKGNSGTGGFDQFADKKALMDAMQRQIDGKAPVYDGKPTQGPAGAADPKAVLPLLEKWTGVTGDGAKEAAVDKFMSNLSQIKAKKEDILPGAPSREDMPIVDGPENQKAADALNAGEIDIYPPYAAESVRRNDIAILERWQRLAGILKD